MAYILAIETSSKNCSVSLFKREKLLLTKEEASDKYSHNEKLTIFIKQLLSQLKIEIKQLDAVAIGKGPGSYTGLRIGTATAKGLCYSLNIPLISVCSLKAMAFSMSRESKYKIFCPMIDAKRMEVFSAIYDCNNVELREVKADIVNEKTYKPFLSEKMLFFGDGAIKCKEVINNKNAQFLENIFPSSRDFGFLAHQKFINKEFEDIAYFEPFYLKDFIKG